MKKFFLIGAIILIVIPTIMVLLLFFPLFKYAPGDLNSWIPFWGSYLGAIIGLSAVVYATHIQLKEQKEYMKNEADLNDRKERSRLYTNLVIERLFELEKLILTLDSVTSKRINIIRDYCQIEEEKQNFEQENNWKKKFKIDLSVGDKSILNKLNNELETYKSTETKYRGEISTLSARLKAMIIFFPEMEDSIDDLRKELVEQLSTPFDIISSENPDVKRLNDFNNKSRDLMKKHNNKIMNIINKKIKSVSEELKTGSNIE